MRISNLELRAKVVVEGFLSGIHRSPYHGFSVEFTEYRQYSPGDDVRYLDWRLYARQDRYYIKRFEDETNLRCYLLVDMSRSMGYGSLAYTKTEYARTTAATLAYFLTLQRDAVGALTFDETIAEYLPARYRPGHLRRLMLALEHALSGKSTNLARPLEEIARAVSKRGLIVLISDLMAPVDSLERPLSYLRSQGHEVIILRILDPAELQFDFKAPSMFQDLESGRQMYVDPQAMREGYQQRFNEHAAAIREVADTLGISLLQVSTADPLNIALFEFLLARSRQRRQVGRRRSNAAAGRGGSGP